MLSKLKHPQLNRENLLPVYRRAAADRSGDLAARVPIPRPITHVYPRRMVAGEEDGGPGRAARSVSWIRDVDHVLFVHHDLSERRGAARAAPVELLEDGGHPRARLWREVDVEGWGIPRGGVDDGYDQPHGVVEDCCQVVDVPGIGG